LFYGEASVETQATRNMIASPEHIADPYCQRHAANSIADFMKTSLDGYTDYPDIPKGLRQYIRWDDPNTPINESYKTTVKLHSLAWLGGDLTWDLFKEEIDADRPVLLNVMAFRAGNSYGHTVVGYGYQDALFQIAVGDAEDPIYVTVGGFAVRDTWDPNLQAHSWYGWDLSPVNAITDAQGVEWWPWVELQVLPGDTLWSWTIFQGITVDIIPEPGTGGLLGMALLVAIRLRSVRDRRVASTRSRGVRVRT